MFELLTRPPVISGAELISALEKIGYVQLRQRGSHVIVRRGSHTCAVPLHKPLKTGTLIGIIKSCGLSVTELVDLL